MGDIVPADDLPSNIVPQSDLQEDHQDKYDPTEGMSGTEKFMAGAGKAVVDTGRGLNYLYARGADMLLDGNRTKAAQQAIDNAAALDKPLMNTGAGLAGNVAGYAGMMAATGGLGDAAAATGVPGLATAGRAASALVNPSTVMGGIGSGAALGAIAPVQTGGSRLWNTVGGGAAGALGNVVSRVPGLFAPPEEAASKAVQALTDSGVPLDAAQRTGSIMLQRAKAMLSDNPLTAGAQRDFMDQQKRSFTRAVLGTIGEDSHEATPEVMAGAMKRIGGVYDDVASRTSIPYDQLEQPLANIEIESRKVLNDSQFATVRRNLDDIMEKASSNGGNINGPQYQNIKQTLDKLSMGSDSDVAAVARDMRQALNNGLTSSAKDPMDVAMLKTANQQWGNMRKIEGVIDKQGDYQISPSKLANTLGTKANRYNSVYGKGDTSLVDLAHAGNALLPERIPNSGTPSRAITAAMVGAAPAAAIGTYEGLKTGDWKTGAEYALGGYFLPKLIQHGLNSQGATGSMLRGIGRASSAGVPLNALVGGALQRAPYGALQAIENRNEDEEEAARK